MQFSIGSFTLGTFFVVLVAAIVRHLLAKSRSWQDQERNRFNNAAKEFSDAFIDIHLNIENAEHPVSEMLRVFFLEHKAAMLKFRPFLRGKRRKDFDKTWQEYLNYYNQNYNSSVYAQFASAKTTFEEEKRKELLKHINNLLRFADYK